MRMRAECVMLNKGGDILDTLRVPGNILLRMKANRDIEATRQRAARVEQAAIDSTLPRMWATHAADTRAETGTIRNRLWTPTISLILHVVILTQASTIPRCRFAASEYKRSL